ncbi:putative lipoprotein [Lewinella marina]|uniref:Peptidase M75 superfamily protein n=1 Tax=Neolewinella marina TaxID=438751 RepID=A0A2G0CIW5_9BACT|nr:imelysin family protein [Neolewinella marina]NJB84938.1 putative lipoprotein [Neolewinella marina]PHK99909.1 peptidase M75 superfamily protein [Neolewinella marina]
MIRFLLLLLVAVSAAGCETDPGTSLAPASFDRAAMLAHWADDVIIPAFEDFTRDADDLQAAATSFEATPTAESLSEVRTAFATAYLGWQRLSPFMTGPGEDHRLREQLNIYPTNTARLKAGNTGSLELPSNTDVQGFPALDFLLYGTESPVEHRGTIAELSRRIHGLSSAALADWTTGGYRDAYVAASGNSATASVDRTVNDFIYWYEKYLRAGKVGIPAGVFSNGPRPELAEAPYHGGLSKQLFLEGLSAGRDFFNGEPGLADYLDALSVEREGQALSARIQSGFIAAADRASGLDADVATQVTTNNTELLQLYDALQANVILLKVDMLQALGINVDYVDADGD